MKRATLIQNIGLAVFLTLFAVISDIIFVIIFSLAWSYKATWVLAVMIYMWFMISNSRLRAGKITVIIANLMILSVSAFFVQSLAGQMLIAAGLIWITRSILRYSGIVSALVDLGLCIAGLSGAGWVFSFSGSFATAVWCFFLILSLECFIPNRLEGNGKGFAGEEVSDFDQAYRSAEDAIRVLAKR